MGAVLPCILACSWADFQQSILKKLWKIIYWETRTPHFWLPCANWAFLHLLINEEVLFSKVNGKKCVLKEGNLASLTHPLSNLQTVKEKSLHSFRSKSSTVAAASARVKANILTFFRLSTMPFFKKSCALRRKKMHLPGH